MKNLYVEFDEETNLWCVFSELTSKSIASFCDKKSALNYLTRV